MRTSTTKPPCALRVGREMMYFVWGRMVSTSMQYIDLRELAPPKLVRTDTTADRSQKAGKRRLHRTLNLGGHYSSLQLPL